MGYDLAYISEIEVNTLIKYNMTIEYSVNSCYMQNKVAYRNLTDNSLLVSTIDLCVQWLRWCRPAMIGVMYYNDCVVCPS
jgi:hypothetical protein